MNDEELTERIGKIRAAKMYEASQAEMYGMGYGQDAPRPIRLLRRELAQALTEKRAREIHGSGL